METEFLPLYQDKIFIDIFGNNDNIKFSEYFLECFFGLEEGTLKDKVKVGFEVTLTREKNHKTSRCDLIFICNDEIINVECYSSFTYASLVKSSRYFTRLNEEVLLKSKKEYNKMTQINIIKKVNLKMPKSLIDEQIKTPMQKVFRISNIRLDQIKNFDYTNSNKRSEDLLLFFKFINAESYEERKNIAKERKILMKLNKTINEYMKGTTIRREEFDYEKNERESHYIAGQIMGKEQGLLETAKKMLLKGFDKNIIADLTNLSLNEIQNINLN